LGSKSFDQTLGKDVILHLTQKQSGLDMALQRPSLINVHEICYVHVVVNMVTSVNIETLSGHALERALKDKLSELLGGVTWLRNWQVEHAAKGRDHGCDLLATLPLPDGKAALCIECKKELRPSAFPTLAEKKLSPPGHPYVVVPVLAMPFVSPRLADLCVQKGWSWYDLAGNCRIDVPNAIHLEYHGRVPVHSRPRPAANLSTPEAGRVIRALLATENSGNRWTQRSMEMHFGDLQNRPPKPSLGLVNKVVRYLQDEAFIEVFPEGGFRLSDPLKLLFAWRDAYRFDRHERRDYFTLLQGKRLRDALADVGLESGGFAAYAVFSAADFQAPHVRQPKTWIYVGRNYLSVLTERIEAKPVDSGDNVTILIPDDDGVFYMADAGTVGEHRLACTNPVQTYVDVYHSGGRGQEAAEAILEQRLKPEWKRSGLL
jgi:Transcriptional regulator, AbiEi antitoxin, Type IV TA system